MLMAFPATYALLSSQYSSKACRQQQCVPFSLALPACLQAAAAQLSLSAKHKKMPGAFFGWRAFSACFNTPSLCTASASLPGRPDMGAITRLNTCGVQGTSQSHAALCALLSAFCSRQQGLSRMQGCLVGHLPSAARPDGAVVPVQRCIHPGARQGLLCSQISAQQQLLLPHARVWKAAGLLQVHAGR